MTMNVYSDVDYVTVGWRSVSDGDRGVGSSTEGPA